MTFTITHNSDTVTLNDPIEISRPASDDVKLVYWRDGTYGADWFGNLGDDIIITGSERKPPCLIFDGTSDKIDLGTGYSATGAFTICFWGLVDSFASERHIVGHDTGSGNTSKIYFNSASQIQIYNSASGLTTVSLTETLLTGKWYHIAITRDGSNNIKVYKNAVDITSGSPTRSGTITMERLFCEPNAGGTDAWDGKIRDVRLFTVAKTASAITNIFKGNEDATSLEAWWKFNYKNGLVIKDQEDNHEGTLSGAVYEGTFIDMHVLESWLGDDVSITGLPDSNFNTDYKLKDITCRNSKGKVYNYDFDINLMVK